MPITLTDEMLVPQIECTDPDLMQYWVRYDHCYDNLPAW